MVMTIKYQPFGLQEGERVRIKIPRERIHLTNVGMYEGETGAFYPTTNPDEEVVDEFWMMPMSPLEYGSEWNVPIPDGYIRAFGISQYAFWYIDPVKEK